ncbi:MAG: CRTAC1 family protein [Acidobacteriota bacterium]
MSLQTRSCLASAVVLVCGGIIGCGRQPADSPPPPPESNAAGVQFVDVTSSVGLDTFRQVSGAPDKLYLPAATGAGVGLFDADGDGDLDVFLINGSRIGGFEEGHEPTNRLFLNDGRGETFHDATAASGLESHGAWGQGLAIADIDRDLDLDLYVTNYERNALYLNQGDGTFSEAAAEAGVDSALWSTGAAFIDYDLDGDLDLYVANFVRYDRVLAAYKGREWLTHTWKGLQVASGPMGLPAAGDQLFRNDSTEPAIRFTEVTVEAGIAAVEPSYGFQPALGDIDGDGFLDLFVANDSRPNFLWRNLSGSGFRESALETGAAYDRAGADQACMGVALEDHEGDGDLDVFVTNFADELNTLYVADGSGTFHDDTLAAGLRGRHTHSNLAWGTFFFDSENDGDLDLFVANGHVYPQVDELAGQESYAQLNELFLQTEPGRYREDAANAGDGFAVRKVSRGAAMGDLDDDGDLDIVINNLDDMPTVLRNDSRPQGHWLKVLLRGSDRNGSAIGARVTLEAAGRRYLRTVRSSDSFLSHHDLRLHFGLGEAASVERIAVDWPDGASEEVVPALIDALVVIEQGRGIVSP